MTTIGEIKLKKLPEKRIVQWKIKEFFSLSEEIYYSRLFSFAKNSWCLSVYPNGHYGNGYINVYLKKMAVTSLIQLEFSLCLKTLKKKDNFETHHIYVFDEPGSVKGPKYLLSRSELLKKKEELVPSDILTIICTVEYPNSTDDTYSSSAQNSEDEIRSESELSSDEEDYETVSSKIKGIQLLSENLKQVLLDGPMSDAVLKVDDQKFNVHKIILVARSPVFASMFQHDLSEKNTNEVDIPDCSAESFQVFLHYIYSGSAETLSTSNVYNVYYAADKYQVDDLKEKCAKFMMKNITVETFCDVIALSLRHGESKLEKNATDFFCQNIKTIVETVQWQKYLAENSTQANELLIKALND